MDGVLRGAFSFPCVSSSLSCERNVVMKLAKRVWGIYRQKIQLRTWTKTFDLTNVLNYRKRSMHEEMTFVWYSVARKKHPPT